MTVKFRTTVMGAGSEPKVKTAMIFPKPEVKVAGALIRI